MRGLERLNSQLPVRLCYGLLMCLSLSASKALAVNGDEMTLPYYEDWPALESSISRDEHLESSIAVILAKMTLEEKVGQMIQPNLNQVTPAEAEKYKLGSLLNGGGSWPGNNKHASAADWAKTADTYWQALANAYSGRGFRVPFMWATDAVHGHNNVFGATLFPHNIGLGAANDPDLIYRIGEVTAREVTATGLDWTFAPTVAVPRNDRWGRTYEGYSEDPAIVHRYASKMVEGLQLGQAGLSHDTQVLATAKHWLGDGGTAMGVDQGENHYSEQQLINLHAPGYFSALEAGAQVVMSSFNSWHNAANYAPEDKQDYNHKIHGSHYLISDVLKGKMGFDGVVITDWNGHGQVSGCTNANCAQAVNAGNDIFMIPERKDWQAFYHYVIAQVKDGTIAKSRIDDAVTRILRVKMRAGLWRKTQPSQRSLAGQQGLIGADSHRALAREAVRKSLVLLKNNDAVLPLRKQQKVYLAGSAADSLEKQHGGWSLSWQGSGNKPEDFPNATTLKQALVQQIGAANIITDLKQAKAGTVAIIAIGEDAYAEGRGDIGKLKTLSFAELKASYAEDVALVEAAKAAGLKVVTVFFSGRPLYVNEVINHSDAFIAAWLPGSEAGGITDVLYRVDDADFTGRLSYSWPNTKCSTAINRIPSHIANYRIAETEQYPAGEYAPLFSYGYGLSYRHAPLLLPTLPLDMRDYDCQSKTRNKQQASATMHVYGAQADNEFALIAMGAANEWQELFVDSAPVDQGHVLVTPFDRDVQYDAANIRFNGNGSDEQSAQVFLQYAQSGRSSDQTPYMNAKSTLQFDMRVKQTPDQALVLGQHTLYPKRADFRFNDFIPEVSEQWSTIKIPLACFPKISADPEHPYDIRTLNTPLLFFTKGQAEFDLSRVRIVPHSEDAAVDALSCGDIVAAQK